MDFAFKFSNNRRANCSREDSNLHGLPHTVLSRTRLPIPPRELENGPLKLLGQFARASRNDKMSILARELTASPFARPCFKLLRFPRFA
jgi:hypothetical protein